MAVVFVGMTITDAVYQAALKAPASAWTLATEPGAEIRDGERFSQPGRQDGRTAGRAQCPVAVHLADDKPLTCWDAMSFESAGPRAFSNDMAFAEACIARCRLFAAVALRKITMSEAATLN